MQMEATIEFSPAIPWRQPFDVEKRIQELRDHSDPNNLSYQPEQQHTNIKAAIKLYEDGKIDGWEQVFIMDGKVVPPVCTESNISSDPSYRASSAPVGPAARGRRSRRN
jgi:hypothetical protein